MREMLLRALPSLIGGAIALAAVVAGIGIWLREPVTALCVALVSRLGAPGLLVGFGMTDLVPLLPHSAVLLIGHAGGIPLLPAFVACSLGAVAGVTAGWSLGRLFGRRPWIAAQLEKRGITAFLQAYGAAAVALASVTPIPDSLCIFGAGAAGLPLRYALLGASIRVPKILVYLLLIEAGWSMGA